MALGFLTSSRSLFSDRYDINGERIAVSHLLAMDHPDPDDPLFARYEEYQRRLPQHEALMAKREKDAAVVSSMGRLQVAEQDTMQLQTYDAAYLFLGRPAGERGPAIVGGRRVAAALRQLWALSGNDNPWADWQLLAFEEKVALYRGNVKAATDRAEHLLASAAARGLSYSVMTSNEPATVALGYASPYGYSVANMLVEFDYAVRAIKSASARDLLTSQEQRDQIMGLTKQCRAIFEPVSRAARLLMREELRPLTRADRFSSESEASKRVQAAGALFGECPKDVFIGERMPRHSRRTVRLSEAELALLNSVPDNDSATLTSGLIT